MKLKAFTTGEVARICKVSSSTVARWFDEGKIKGYRIPGTRVRRIPAEYVRSFLKETGRPLDGLEEEGLIKVFLYSGDTVLINNMSTAFGSEDFLVRMEHQGFAAGVQVESFKPQCIICDFSIGLNEIGHLVDTVLSYRESFGNPILIGLLQDSGEPCPLAGKFRVTFKKPFDHESLVAKVKEVVAR